MIELLKDNETCVRQWLVLENGRVYEVLAGFRRVKGSCIVSMCTLTDYNSRLIHPNPQSTVNPVR